MSAASSFARCGCHGVGFAQRSPFGHRVRERVQDVALGVGMKQRLGLVLAVKVYQEGTDPAEHGDGGGTAVDPGAGAPVAGDLAANDQPVILRIEPGSVEAAPEGRIGKLECALDDGAPGTRAAPCRCRPAPPEAAPSRPPAWTSPPRFHR